MAILLFSFSSALPSSLPGQSGRRKLDFGSQQFRGKSFFLDLSGYRHSTEVERELVARGGVSGQGDKLVLGEG